LPFRRTEDITRQVNSAQQIEATMNDLAGVLSQANERLASLLHVPGMQRVEAQKQIALVMN
jgi:hypothetical protein